MQPHHRKFSVMSYEMQFIVGWLIGAILFAPLGYLALRAMGRKFR